MVRLKNQKRKSKKGLVSVDKSNPTASAYPFNLKGKIWIDGSLGTFIGYGRVILLERIKEYGSITKAAGSMDISYKHAWELVDSMNRQSPFPLVNTSSGGKGGGGAFLTEHGEDSIKIYWKLYGHLQKFIEREQKTLKIYGKKSRGHED